MIQDIQELNFPDYATLSQATVMLNDMGDKTISTQVKIDGTLAPDFSYDWEVEFQGERYIQPLRQPQASKGNESICSTIDLTFYHKTIYDLKRYFFVEMTTTESGTAMADKYIADLSVNLGTFCEALQRVLDYYYEDEERIIIDLNSEWEYAQESQYVQIQYTHIWDVIQKMHDLFGVRWSIEGRTLRIGYPAEEVAHTFEYGFEGGLLRVERQVQSADIRNSLLGRGGSKNLPYLYFKDLDKYGETDENGTWTPDPDAIPELRSIYFTELRGKTFRDYVQGWKTNPNRDLSYGDVVEEYDTERGESPQGWAYKTGHEDKTFNPIEYVEDKDSIAKYGLLQGGLENQEDIYPSIQGVEVEPYGRIDEVVEVEQVLVDDTEEPTSQNIHTESIDASYSREGVAKGTKSLTISVTSPYFTIPEGFKGGFLDNISVSASANYWFQRVQGNSKQGILWGYRGTSTKTVLARVTDAQVYEAGTNNRVTDIAKLSDNTKYLYVASVEIYGDFPKDENKSWKTADGSTAYDNITIDNSYTINVGLSWELDATTIPSLVVGNYTDGINRIYGEIKDLAKNSEKSIDINSEVFIVPASGATMVDAPINIIATDSKGNDISGTYEWEKSVELVNTATNEVLSSINIPQGEYYARVNVRIKNNHTSSANYRIELLPSYVYFPIDTAQWQPTFDIWVKNIWGTTRNEGESAEAYAERVWQPILGDREGNEAKVVFTTGWLSGHSDYEFAIVDVAYANDVPNAEWRITLAKSDAELEATGVYIPSTTQQANKGDKFFFIGIDMPHQYILWAEERLDNYKRDQLLDTAHIKPTWVVQTDKVRLNQLQEGESELLLNAFKVGNSIRLADTRFIEGAYERLYLQSVTYTWDAQTHIYPNVEVVLSDKIATVSNPVQQIQGDIETLTKQVGSLSNMQQVIRAIGDKLYLRKDGIEELCKSPVEFLQEIASKGFRQGIVGGKGWGVYTDANGNATIECDVVKARQDLQVNNIVANQVTAVGGKQIESAASIVCSRVDATEQGFVCYFDTHNGSIRNLFQVNDIAYSQVFSPDNAQTKSYKREVVAVSEDSITLSIASNGEGLPQVGDVIVHYGSTTDTSRQYVIIRDVIGGGYERMLSGLNSVSASGEEYYFAGRLEGNTPRWFVGDVNKQYIEYKDGILNIKANVTLGAGSDISNAPEIANMWNQDVITPADLLALETELSKITTEYENIKAQSDKFLSGEALDHFGYYEYCYGEYSGWLGMIINVVKQGNIDERAARLYYEKGNYYSSLKNVSAYISSAIKTDITDLDYLKQVFPDAVLDVNGATLSLLLGVKDGTSDDAQVVAGLYGGGDETLNNNGFYDHDIYEDEENGLLKYQGHGALLMFAGADGIGANRVSTAKFKVYQDGYVESMEFKALGSVGTMFKKVSNIEASVSITPDKQLNLSFQQNGIISLPMPTSFVGSRIILHNATYPPYTRSGVDYSTLVKINPNSQYGIVGYYPDLSVDITSAKSLSSFSFIGGVVELLGVPSENGDETQWVLINGHNCIKNTTTKDE